MNRVGFMSQLEGLLADIPAAEREEAVQYYRDYFEDAGSENEAAVLQSLGSPQKIAENIKAELGGEVLPSHAKPGDHALTKYGQIASGERTGGEGNARSAEASGGFSENRSYRASGEAYGGAASYGGEYKERKKGLPAWGWILLVILAAMLMPGLFGVFAGIAGVLFGLIAAWFGLMLGAGITAVALLASALTLVVLSFACLFTGPIVFVGVLGAGLLCGSFGLLALMLTVWMAGRATPGLFRACSFCIKKLWQGICALWHKVF